MKKVIISFGVCFSLLTFMNLANADQCTYFIGHGTKATSKAESAMDRLGYQQVDRQADAKYLLIFSDLDGVDDSGCGHGMESTIIVRDQVSGGNFFQATGDWKCAAFGARAAHNSAARELYSRLPRCPNI